MQAGNSRPYRFLSVLTSMLLCSASVGFAATQALPEVKILTGATLVGIDGEPSIPNAVVVIKGERIEAAGPASAIPLPEGATPIDLGGKWLLPGLMNMHVHLGLILPGAQGNALAFETNAEMVLRMARNARRSLYSGVTTVRLVGEGHAYDFMPERSIGVDFVLKRAIERGEVVGPRIETAGYIIAITGGHGDSETDGPYAMAKAAREQIKQGATWIKLAISGGIADSHGSISAAPMTDDELSTVIEAAHRLGVPVTAHNGSPEAAAQALKFGIDGFEHGYHLTVANLREMKAKGTWLVPTIVVSQAGAMEFFKKIGSPDWYLERVKSTGKDHWAMLQNAIKLGVNIALGTDQFPYEPNSGTTATVEEVELYVAAGMTPLQALQSATIQAARMLKRDDIGRIAAGKYADIIAIDADPLQDIKALRTIHFVMKGGAVIRDDEDPAMIDHEGLSVE